MIESLAHNDPMHWVRVMPAIEVLEDAELNLELSLLGDVGKEVEDAQYVLPSPD